jgi:CheY-like chemotaxis protein
MPEKVLKILLLEDNAGDALLLNEFLEGSPFDWMVKTTDRLARAVTILQEERFNLVMMDLSLPDSSGDATLLNIREAAPDLPVIVLSGTSSDESQEQLVRLGARAFLQKGQLTPEGLWETIEAIVGEKSEP